MPLTEIIIRVSFHAAFALLGRWMLLRPEKVIPKGSFGGPQTFAARVFRTQIAFIGIFALFGGTYFAVFGLLSIFSSTSVIMHWGRIVAALCAAIFAAVWVRKEVKSRPKFVSNHPYGWWP